MMEARMEDTGRDSTLHRDSRSRAWWNVVLPSLVVTIACLLATAAGWDNSATNDEPYHALASFTYVHDGHGDLNPEHPPLAKLLSGLALLPLGLHGSAAGPVQRLYVLGPEVRRFLYANTSPAPSILRAGRLPQLLFLLALLMGVYRWTAMVSGPRTALLAMMAVAAQPLVLGHAFVIHTDLAAAATWTWTFYLLHRWLRGSRRGWIVFGVALGLALLAKFTGVYLVPATIVVVLAYTLRSRRYADLLRLIGAGLVAFTLVIAGAWLPLRNGSLAEERATITAALGLWQGTAPLVRDLDALAAASRPLAHYALGVAYVYETNLHGQGINYFLGRLSTEGFAWYFPVALVLKTSLPFLVLAVAGLWWTLRRRDPFDLALAAGVAAYFALSLGTSYNIGARHLLPILPLLAIIGARSAATWARWPRWLLAATLVASPIAAFPHYIAHFSVLVGGHNHGSRYLNDSNLDWGQDWDRLATEARRRSWRPLAFAYIGAAYPPSAMPDATDALERPDPPSRGYVAVSSYAANVGVPYLRALGRRIEADRLEAVLASLARNGDLVGNVGGTIAVYRIREPGG
jgi:hypothetical protein